MLFVDQQFIKKISLILTLDGYLDFEIALVLPFSRIIPVYPAHVFLSKIYSGPLECKKSLKITV